MRWLGSTKVSSSSKRIKESNGHTAIFTRIDRLLLFHRAGIPWVPSDLRPLQEEDYEGP